MVTVRLPIDGDLGTLDVASTIFRGFRLKEGYVLALTTTEIRDNGFVRIQLVFATEGDESLEITRVEMVSEDGDQNFSFGEVLQNKDVCIYSFMYRPMYNEDWLLDVLDLLIMKETKDIVLTFLPATEEVSIELRIGSKKLKGLVGMFEIDGALEPVPDSASP